MPCAVTEIRQITADINRIQHYVLIMRTRSCDTCKKIHQVKKMDTLFIKIILYLTIVSSAYGLKKNLVDNGELNLNVANCVLKLSAKYLVSKKALSGSIVIINIDSYNSTTQMTLLKTIHKGYKYSIMVKDSAYVHRNASHFPEKAKNYMMILEKKEDLLRNINQLNKLPTWNPHAKAVVFIRYEPEFDLDILIKELIDTLREYKLLETIVFVHFPETDEVISYSWKPYSETNCGGKCDKIYKLDLCRNNRVIQINPTIDMIPAEFNRCPLKVFVVVSEPYVLPPNYKINNSIYKDEYNFNLGIEINLIKIIAEFTNMTVIFRMSDIPEDWGYIDKYGNVSGIYSKLKSEEVDVIIGDLEVDPIKRKYFDASHTYMQDFYTWCVPKAGTAPTWSNLITIFKLSTWMTTFAFVIIVSLMFHWLKRREYPKLTRWPTRSILMTVGMILGWGGLFNPKSLAFRLLLFSWLIFSININTSYQSFLRSFLIHPKYEKQIETQEKIVEAQFGTGGKLSIRSRFEGSDKVSKYIYDHYEICPSFKEYIRRVGIDKNFAVAIPYSQSLYYSQRLQKGTPLVYCFPEENMIYKYGIVILTKKWFPILNKFNYIIRSVSENGLIWKWKNEVYLQKLSANTNDIVPLSMTHMLGAFLLILISYLICFVVFVFEHLCHRLSIFYRKNKKQIV